MWKLGGITVFFTVKTSETIIEFARKNLNSSSLISFLRILHIEMVSIRTLATSYFNDATLRPCELFVLSFSLTLCNHYAMANVLTKFNKELPLESDTKI